MEDYDYDYEEGFLDPEIIEDYEDQTVEEYYEAHEDEFQEDYIEDYIDDYVEDYVEDYIDDYVEDYVEEYAEEFIPDHTIDIMIARLDHLIAKVEAGRIPGKNSTKQPVQVTYFGHEPKIKETPKTYSIKTNRNSEVQKDNILSFIIAVGILFIFSIILIMGLS